METANGEYQVARYLRKSSTGGSNSTPFIGADVLTELIPPLLSIAEGSTETSQDTFEARVCLGWIHFTLSEPALAASRFPRDFAAALDEFSDQNIALPGWTEVCIVIGVCLKGRSILRMYERRMLTVKGAAQAQSGSPSQGLITFQSIYPWVLRREAKPPNPQFAYWLTQYFAQFALTASQNVNNKSSNAGEQIDLTLQVFRLWANHVKQKRDPTTKDARHDPDLIQPETVWRDYYRFLSKLLQEGRIYSPSGQMKPRLQQYIELKRVETIHENNILRTTRFPKANESNRAIENWVEEAFRNWVILSGSDWQDEDLGEGGRNAVGRNMLDVLYRAATKSFQSTLILRRLFQVHKSLTEFDLAYKAFDIYLEITTRAKTRLKKSGEPPSGIDGNDSVFCTVAEGIEGLCCFGAFKEAEKAHDLSMELSAWIGEVPRLRTARRLVNGHVTENHDNTTIGEQEISPETFTLAHRAIGIGKANWAYWTPVNEDRKSIQASAILDLKTAFKGDQNLIGKVKAAFALGLLFAETRDLDGSTDVLRQALDQSEAQGPDQLETLDVAGNHSKFYRERQLIRLRHLFGLVLSAKQDFENADRSCKAAFEEFLHGKILFGHEKQGELPKQNGELEKLNPNASTLSERHGLLDVMDSRELEQIMEIRLTELAIIELTEGSEIAISASNELQSLFTRLFSTLALDLEKKSKDSQELAPPKSSAGTVRSFRSSIFGRKKQTVPSLRNSSLIDSNAPSVPSIPERKPSSRYSRTPRSDNPTIQITNEDLPTRLEKVSFEPTNDLDQDTPKSVNKLHRREGSINKMIRHHSEHKAHRQPGSRLSSARQSFETGREEPLTPDEIGVAVSSYIPPPVSPTSNHDSSPTAKQSLSRIAHNMPPDSQPPPPGQHVQPPEQDVRLPSISPESSRTHLPPRFPLAQAQAHALALLTKIWLQISSLYQRASLFDDAREAVDEAARHAHHIETIMATLYGSSSDSFSERKWGGGKSGDEIFAEVFASKGHLLVARGDPHAAMDMFEVALDYFQDCPSAIVGLSECLLDIYEQKIAPEKPSLNLMDGIEPLVTGLGTVKGETQPTSAPTPTSPTKSNSRPGTARSESHTTRHKQTSHETGESLRKTPTNLNRIAARDRAYGLLSTLTKLGSGCDDSRAWFALARALELGGEIDKAKDVLWWCVELEDSKPIRRYDAVKGRGGYVL